jgi:hypothetical protein
MSVQGFWAVVKDAPTTSFGRRYPTLEAARAEAERLARKERFATFLVLRAVGAAGPVSPEIEWRDAAPAEPDDERGGGP